MPRETVDVLDACAKSPITHLHNWLAIAHNTAWGLVEVFCNRCRTKGIFTSREVEQWRDVVDHIWLTYGHYRRER